MRAEPNTSLETRKGCQFRHLTFPVSPTILFSGHSLSYPLPFLDAWCVACNCCDHDCDILGIILFSMTIIKWTRMSLNTPQRNYCFIVCSNWLVVVVFWLCDDKTRSILIPVRILQVYIPLFSFDYVLSSYYRIRVLKFKEKIRWTSKELTLFFQIQLTKAFISAIQTEQGMFGKRESGQQ